MRQLMDTPGPPTAPAPAAGPPALWFSVLGPLTLRVGGRAVPPGPLKQQLFLAALLAHPGRAVSLEALTETIWRGEPPRTARKNLQVYASTLRRLLGPDGAGLVEHGPGGYRLRLRPAECDALRFEELARQGVRLAQSGAAGAAGDHFRAALDLWRHDPMAPLADRAPLLRAAAERWRERHLEVYESWAETRLDGGDPAAVAETVGELAARHPLRERLRVAQLRALRLCGRRSEALAVYDDCRRRLSAELGLAPGAGLERAYRAVLADEDPAGPRRASGRPRPGPVRLPPDLEDFTGREGLCADLLAGLAREPAPGVVLAAGPGGGATALAVRVAHRAADRFPDGRVAASLRDLRGRPRPWPSVLAELSRSLGRAAELPVPGAPPEESAAAWRAWLADHRVLLLLDGARGAEEIRPLLPGAGPSAALITARDPVPGLEPVRRVHVPPLTGPEGVRLLRGLLGGERVDAEPAAAHRVVAAVGGLPLALRIAGHRLRLLPHTALGEYAERLENADEALDQLAVGAWSVREHLAGAARALEPEQRETLRALGALPSPEAAPSEAARALARSPRETRRLLESLVTCGMLTPPGATPPDVLAHAAPGSAASFTLPRLTWLLARESRAPRTAGRPAVAS